jgi:hypothetical protein
MKTNPSRALAPSLALGLPLVTQALGRPQALLSGVNKPEPKSAAKGDDPDGPDARG